MECSARMCGNTAPDDECLPDSRSDGVLRLDTQALQNVAEARSAGPRAHIPIDIKRAIDRDRLSLGLSFAGDCSVCLARVHVFSHAPRLSP